MSSRASSESRKERRIITAHHALAIAAHDSVPRKDLLARCCLPTGDNMHHADVVPSLSLANVRTLLAHDGDDLAGFLSEQAADE